MSWKKSPCPIDVRHVGKPSVVLIHLTWKEHTGEMVFKHEECGKVIHLTTQPVRAHSEAILLWNMVSTLLFPQGNIYSLNMGDLAMQRNATKVRYVENCTSPEYFDVDLRSHCGEEHYGCKKYCRVIFFFSIRMLLIRNFLAVRWLGLRAFTGARMWSLVRELRSCNPCSVAKRKRNVIHPLDMGWFTIKRNEM